MIPRQLDLVPEIRGPLSDYDDNAENETVIKINSESCQNTSTRQEMTRSVKRYVLMPMTSSNDGETTKQYDSTHIKRESVNMNNNVVDSSSSRLLQLVSFISSPECIDAPIELMEMSSRTFTREQDFSGVNDDDDDDDDNDDTNNNRNSRTGTWANNNNNNATRERESSVKFKKQGKKLILRSVYKSVRPTNSHRFSSIPLPEYEEFTPILLHWPANNGTLTNLLEASSSTRVTEVNQVETCQMEILESPVIELRCERAEGVDHHGSLKSQQSISSNWLSSQTTKIKKADWKNMDAYDKEVGKVSRWSMEEALDDEGNDIHLHKTYKLKGNNTKANANKSTSTAVANSYVGRVSKNEKISRGVLKRARDSAFALQSRIQIPRLHNNTFNTMLTDPHNAPSNYNNSSNYPFNGFNINNGYNNSNNSMLHVNKTSLQHKQISKNENVVENNLSVENNRRKETTKTITQDRNIADNLSAEETLMPPPTITATAARRTDKHKNTIKLTNVPLVEQEYSHTNKDINGNKTTNGENDDGKTQEKCENIVNSGSNEVNKDNVEELDKCASVVLDELRASGKESASLKELERLILKKLPDYAMVAEKSRNSATKAEAVKWFHVHQQKLKEWLLVKQKYIVDKTGKVYFT